MPSSLIRIISDLHFGDSSSRLRNVAQLRPLLSDAPILILNGDTLDTHHHPAPAEALAQFHELFQQHCPRHLFITGNHDPDISIHHEIACARSGIWLTHGDIFFPDIAPWSRIQPELARRVRTLTAAAQSKSPTLTRADLFSIHRQASLRVPYHEHTHNPALFRRITRFLGTLFPPRQSIAMLRAWQRAPALTRAFAASHHPHARILITGHTHFPGHWPTADGRIVINTGSFSPPLGGLAVEIDDTELRLRRIRLRNQEFHLAAPHAKFPLAAPLQLPLSASL